MLMDNSSKTVFLDIDHVLTNTDLDNSSFLSFDPSKYHLSSINLKWLDVLLEKSQAKIVISSNWRRFEPPNIYWNFNGKQYASTLEPFKKMYGGLIIDMLPKDRHVTKSNALELWIEDNPWFSKTKSKYVILEDDVREGFQIDPVFVKHLVLTDHRYGLTKNDVDKALKILS